ncbi:hypothetical protein HOLleu_05452 [Holothuria leucospilota]|uniref:Uncharacterized protein n=1 Tax=Holothuria leucospilota TaxID=206669 RepID=A0A9Q1CL14_HOLLE|nr:hypothetical protein HOLleu_05452 [Holothuria leucospilota]
MPCDYLPRENKQVLTKQHTKPTEAPVPRRDTLTNNGKSNSEGAGSDGEDSDNEDILHNYARLLLQTESLGQECQGHQVSSNPPTASSQVPLAQLPQSSDQPIGETELPQEMPQPEETEESPDTPPRARSARHRKEPVRFGYQGPGDPQAHCMPVLGREVPLHDMTLRAHMTPWEGRSLPPVLPSSLVQPPFVHTMPRPLPWEPMYIPHPQRPWMPFNMSNPAPDQNEIPQGNLSLEGVVYM